jgi:dihydrolipoamide dehydrogenase
MERFDIAVIGAGPGGFRAAIRCAQKGASVAIIEKDFIGGTCLNYGCIPSKTLLASAHVLLAAKNADTMGINIASATPNWHKIQTRRENIITDLRKAMTASLKITKTKWFQGQAVVTSPNRLKIETNGSISEIHADKIIIATGSEPIQLAEIPFDSKIIISSKEALSLEQIPKSMVVVGGGVIGCELACVFAAVGTKVTIVEMLPFLLASEDQWVGKLIEREFKKLGINILTSQKVVSVDKNNKLAKVFLENGQTIDAEKVLVAVGRKACCDKETIEALNLEMQGSAIKINEKMETSVKGVYAIGDAAGKTYLAHGATTEADVAAANAMGGDVKMPDYSLIPRVIYTFPEAASVGKNEQTCKSEGLNVSVGKAFFRANGRSAASNETVGEIRVVKNNSTNKIIGITMAGAMVTELVAAAAAFIGRQEKDTQITFAHPTISETLKEAVENAFT